MKTFRKFMEQAAVAPAPQPTAKPIAKAAPKPKVTDASAGVDVDKYSRWQGNVVNLGKELEPEKTEITPGKKGPDANLPAGEANPNKKRRDDENLIAGAGPIPIPPDFVKDSMRRRNTGKDYSIEDKKNIIRWNQGLIKPVG